jgi:hypothetical protein
LQCSAPFSSPVASSQDAAAASSKPETTTSAPAEEPRGSAASGDIDITFDSHPDPPRMGENTFEVVVTSSGEPVTDANVAVDFFMPAMPSMNMPEMKNSVSLQHEGGGRYRGAGNVMMAGTWNVTVRVTRGGQEVGSRTLELPAK